MTDYQDDNILMDEELNAKVALDGGPKPEDYDTPEDVVVTDEGIIEAAELLHKNTNSDNYIPNNIEVDERGGIKVSSGKIREVLKERTGYSSSHGSFNQNKSAAYEVGVALAGIAEAAGAPGNPDFGTLADEAAEDAAGDKVYGSLDHETVEVARDIQEGLKAGAEDGVDYIDDQDLDLEDFEEPSSLFGFL